MPGTFEDPHRIKWRELGNMWRHIQPNTVFQAGNTWYFAEYDLKEDEGQVLGPPEPLFYCTNCGRDKKKSEVVTNDRGDNLCIICLPKFRCSICGESVGENWWKLRSHLSVRTCDECQGPSVLLEIPVSTPIATSGGNILRKRKDSLWPSISAQTPKAS